MTTSSPHQTASLIRRLVQLPAETEWVEFKHNYADPETIGEYISALANSAALVGEQHGYLVWGVEDRTHALVGTSFQPAHEKVGNEDLENWLRRLSEPKLAFGFRETELDGRRFVLLEVEATFHHPARFKGHGHIRIGSYKKQLVDHPDKEKELWRALDRVPFERGIAAEEADGGRIAELLDTAAVFEMQSRPMPRNQDDLLRALTLDDIIRPSKTGGWDVTNLGAILFARRLDHFPSLQRKAIRVIQYKGNSRVETLREQEGGKGYATGFDGLLEYVAGVLPTNEVIGRALRRTVPMFPELAIREVVANAMIHQDLFVTGAGPMVEIFSDRVEVSNPGAPLIDTDRFLDSAPRSRNEKLASLMRRLGICEERGSGVDKVVFELEAAQLPAPIFEASSDTTRVVLLGHRPLTKMGTEDRVRACYLHACLRYVNREYVTNSSIRERFGLDDRNMAKASRLIREAVDAGAIVLDDAEAPPRYMKYVPWWAKVS